MQYLATGMPLKPLKSGLEGFLKGVVGGWCSPGLCAWPTKTKQPIFFFVQKRFKLPEASLRKELQPSTTGSSLENCPNLFP